MLGNDSWQLATIFSAKQFELMGVNEWGRSDLFWCIGVTGWILATSVRLACPTQLPRVPGIVHLLAGDWRQGMCRCLKHRAPSTKTPLRRPRTDVRRAFRGEAVFLDIRVEPGVLLQVATSPYLDWQTRDVGEVVIA